jgi:hypothetical protein
MSDDYRPRAQWEIWAMTDEQLNDAEWRQQILDHDDRETWHMVQTECDRRELRWRLLRATPACTVPPQT